MSDGPEQVVPLGVTARVVQDFESVQIEVRDREARASSLRALDLAFRDELQTAPVVEPGEGVCLREFGQAKLHLAQPSEDRRRSEVDDEAYGRVAVDERRVSPTEAQGDVEVGADADAQRAHEKRRSPAE